jgi:hypothetical protein
VATIDKNEKQCQLLAVQNIARNDMLKLLGLRFTAFCISIAGQVYQIPLIVYKKMIDEQSLSRSGRCHRQFPLVREHIDKARLTHIGTSNESILGFSILWTLLYVGVADYEFRVFYDRRIHRNIF